MKRYKASVLFIICTYIATAQSNIKTAKDLDMLWNQYFECKDFSAITAIVNVLELDDQFRNEINTFLCNNVGSNDVKRLIELLKEMNFGLNTDNTNVVTDYNIDGVLFYLLSDNYFRPRIIEITNIVGSKKSTFEMMKVKGAAIWSLQSNCGNHEEVYNHVENIKSGLSKSTQYTIDKLILHKK